MSINNQSQIVRNVQSLHIHDCHSVYRKKKFVTKICNGVQILRSDSEIIKRGTNKKRVFQNDYYSFIIMCSNENKAVLLKKTPKYNAKPRFRIMYCHISIHHAT